MEPRDRAAQALTSPTTRLRLAATALLLVGLAFAQQPGLLVADTKLDLVLDPGHFLGRTLHLWDGASAFGQLQNQAYGYLWPMGPFFWLGDGLDVPGWAVQRGWLALVVVVAFLGAALLARALGARSDLAVVLAGLAFSLSPRMLTTLGPISIEAWPSALAPWVLLPLVLGAQRGSPRRAAAASALAVAMVGGVNAAATAAVLPLGAWWLLTRTRGARRRSLMLWWPALTVVATLWWLLPLLVLGGYSPPFLDYIESAANTTFPTTLFDALRGTSNWVPYVDTTSRAGGDLIRDVPLIVNSGVLVSLGIIGILTRGHPHRLFLGGGVLIGLLLVTAGHLGGASGWAAPELRELLDGSLAPLRNVHKFDPVIRLPLVLGLALFLDAVVTRREEARPRVGVQPSQAAARRLNTRLVAGTAVVAVLGAALPALVGRIPPVGATAEVPDYWYQAAGWLDGQDAGTALLVPGSSFGEYAWGYPHDEPFQSLARSPWAVRNAVPLTPAGNIRMLDAIERRLAQGQGSVGMAPYLRRAGVSHLVVRNDLERSSDVPDPVLVHQAISASPGLTRVATFGPVVGGEAHLEDDDGSRILINGGWQNEYPAVEVYAVEDADGRADVEAAGAETARVLPVVVGGPEDLLDLEDLGVLGAEPTLLGADADPRSRPAGPVVLTDGLRLTERNFGRVHDGSSQTLTDSDPLRLSKPARDYLEDDSDRWATRAETLGGRVAASSSMSDANAPGVVTPGEQPFAAVDGDPATAWVAGYQPDRTTWWELRPEESRRADEVLVTAGADDEVVRVRTSAEEGSAVTVPAGTTRRVALVGDEVSWVRVEDASGRPGHQMSLAEVEVPGVEVSRSLRLPALPDAWGAPAAVVLRAVGDARTGCADVDRAVRCVPDRDVASEEPDGFRRTVTLPDAQDFDAALMVRARPGDPLVADLLSDQPIGVSASSTGSPDQRASALAAIDGDRGTTWTAALDDLRPELRLSWLGARVVDGIRMRVAPDSSARLPETVTVVWPDGQAEVRLDASGRVELPDVVTDQLVVRVEEAEAVTSLAFDSTRQPVPVGISTFRVIGVPYAPVALGQQSVERPCGSGPDIVVGGRTVQTQVTASAAEVYSGVSVPAELCGDPSVGLRAGDNDLRVVASDSFTPVSLTLTDPGTPDPLVASPTSASPVRDSSGGGATWSPRGEAGAVLSLDINTNPGWRAEQDGAGLAPVVVDGWRQAWRLEGPGEVRTSFSPDRAYRTGLLGGAVLLLGMVLWCAFWRRWPEDVEPLGAAAPPPAVLALAGLVCGGLLAGWPGAAAAAVGLGLALVVSRWFPAGAAPLVAVVLVPAVLAYVVRPWGSADGWAGALGWPHYLVVVACVLPLAWRSADDDSGELTERPRVLNRIAGRSRTR